MTLADLLRPRTTMLGGFLMYKSPHYEDPNNPWHYYSFTEGLTPDYPEATTCVYTRPSHPNAKIVLKNIQMSGLANSQWGKPVVVQSDQKERYVREIDIDKGVDYDDTLTHTFSKTTTLEEAAKVGMELEIKTHFGYAAGVAGGGFFEAEINAKISAEYSRKWGSSETTTDTVQSHIHLAGPYKGTWVAERSLDKLQMTLRTTPQFEYQTLIYSGDTLLHQWDSLQDIYQVLKGEAPNNVALGKEYRSTPLADVEFAAIDNHKIEDLRVVMNYDSVHAASTRVQRYDTKDPIHEKPIKE